MAMKTGLPLLFTAQSAPSTPDSASTVTEEASAAHAPSTHAPETINTWQTLRENLAQLLIMAGFQFGLENANAVPTGLRTRLATWAHRRNNLPYPPPRCEVSKHAHGMSNITYRQTYEQRIP